MVENFAVFELSTTNFSLPTYLHYCNFQLIWISIGYSQAPVQTECQTEVRSIEPIRLPLESPDLWLIGVPTAMLQPVI